MKIIFCKFAAVITLSSESLLLANKLRSCVHVLFIGKFVQLKSIFDTLGLAEVETIVVIGMIFHNPML